MTQQEWRNLCKDIHENAVNHGWWETERPRDETYAMIHSEVSEALDEYRNAKEMVYFDGDKPEGIAVELMDMVIRIIDYLQHDKAAVLEYRSIDQILGRCPFACQIDFTMTRLVAYLHQNISMAFMNVGDKHNEQRLLINAISAAMNWCDANGADPISVIETKHAYNITRPYRHGGKIC